MAKSLKETTMKNRTYKHKNIEWDIDVFLGRGLNFPFSGHETVLETIRIVPENGINPGYTIPGHKRRWDFPALLLENLKNGDTIISIELGMDEEYKKIILWSSNKVITEKTVNDVIVPFFYDMLLGNDDKLPAWRKKMRHGRKQ